MFDPPITATGTIIDSPKAKIYHVSLANGKVVIGHIAKAYKHLHDEISIGDTVSLELTPYDFEKARITAVQKQ